MYKLSFFICCTLRVPVAVLSSYRWRPGVRRIGPWHPLVCRRGRVHGSAYLPWVVTRVGGEGDPSGRGSLLLVIIQPKWPTFHFVLHDITWISSNSLTTKCSLQMREFLENDIRNWKLVSFLVWHNKRLALYMTISAEFRPSSTVVDVSIWVNMSWVQENLIQPSHQENQPTKGDQDCTSCTCTSNTTKI